MLFSLLLLLAAALAWLWRWLCKRTAKSINCGMLSYAVTTKDGYRLLLFRAAAAAASWRGPVLLLHGCMQNSDVWHVPGSASNFVSLLTADGWDVWLGNFRGNKYSCQHASHSPSSLAYWDFCLDELIGQDFPAMLAAVHLQSGATRPVAIIAFSQATFVIQAALRQQSWLADMLGSVVLLASTSVPRLLPGSLLARLCKTSPAVLRCLFGRRAFLAGITQVARDCLPARLYAAVLAKAMGLLFGWRLASIPPGAGWQSCPFHYLYCSTSVGVISHWFSLIAAGSCLPAPGTVEPTAANSCQISHFVGDADCLAADDLPAAVRLPDYEHLDFLWSVRNAKELFPLIKKALAGR